MESIKNTDFSSQYDIRDFDDLLFFSQLRNGVCPAKSTVVDIPNGKSGGFSCPTGCDGGTDETRT